MEPHHLHVSRAASAVLSDDEAERLMFALEDRLSALINSPRHSSSFAPGSREEAERICMAAAAGRPVPLSSASEDGLLFLLSLVQRFWIELGRGTASLACPPGEELALGLLWQSFLEPSRAH